MKLNKHRVVFGAALLLASIPVAAPANAAYGGASTVERSMSVKLADLNLTTEAGIDMLYKRLQHAAEVVCGPQDLRSAGSVTALRQNKKCYSEALDRAVADIGREDLVLFQMNLDDVRVRSGR